MIISEENTIEEEKRKKEDLIKCFADINLPEKYKIDFDYQKISRKGRFNIDSVKIANFSLLNDGIISIQFNEEDEYKELKEILNNSKTKFKVRIPEDYY